MADVTALADAGATIEPIDLGAYDGRAALRTRVDRKYLVPVRTAVELLQDVAAGVRILEVDQRREHHYRSLYFDTVDRRIHRAAAHRRRPRFKIRTRRYEDGQAWTELKLRSRRSERTKLRTPTRGVDRLDADDLGFITSRLHEVVGATSTSWLGELEPVLWTDYRRMSLLHPESATRCTLDVGVRCGLLDGRCVEVPRVVVETKSGGHATRFDWWLWRHGHRPVSFSKYTTALAVLEPDLPSNRWHRVLGRAFD